ncbi:peptidase associated/transthyretin-like domain-containing protein [Brumimicrobium oceani]|uniref:Carboxypeptidase regulatory-like domain-containing protein n=1 Tax=Brumimicrobium oceani TaxID=2100725 RepID=A0A2U2XEI2_9FLAO|nr:hypothetical protein [Brumimicrobium oceani]PWH86111.1 hypothetical protein DIT68_06030 [Brumimicrobium oceani]
MMNKYAVIFLVTLLPLFSCKKIEGEGGRSTIVGKVFMSDKSGNNQGEYFIPDYDVFIIYGEENDIYDEDMKTNFDGSFEFKNLREGTYTIYSYSEVSTNPSGLEPVFKTVTIGKKETVDIGTIEVSK